MSWFREHNERYVSWFLECRGDFVDDRWSRERIRNYNEKYTLIMLKGLTAISLVESVNWRIEEREWYP